MRIIKTVKTLKKHLDISRNEGLTIGFIPTMGALHEGHMSLIDKSKSQNKITVVSVFVNPTQFNDKSDLDKYPRTLENDAAMLKARGCDIVFAPSNKQIYPTGEDMDVTLDITSLTRNMEGPNRPGHFEGVVQVVHRLLSIVGPNKLYMGQKDFQQFSIIAYMLKKLKMKTKLVVCPIIREEDGLAMSSRNVRLTKSSRSKAPIVHQTLVYAKEKLGKIKVSTIEKNALAKLSEPGFKPEYFKIVDGITMEPIKDHTDHKYIVACVALWAKDVRLIDNMILRKGK